MPTLLKTNRRFSLVVATPIQAGFFDLRRSRSAQPSASIERAGRRRGDVRIALIASPCSLLLPHPRISPARRRCTLRSPLSAGVRTLTTGRASSRNTAEDTSVLLNSDSIALPLNQPQSVASINGGHKTVRLAEKKGGSSEFWLLFFKKEKKTTKFLRSSLASDFLNAPRPVLANRHRSHYSGGFVVIRREVTERSDFTHKRT
jgi:hypothetical protein